MKRFEQQTSSEGLRVNPATTTHESQSAYEPAREADHRDSLAPCPLWSEPEGIGIQEALEGAYRVLIGDKLRNPLGRLRSRMAGRHEEDKSTEAEQALPDLEGSRLSFTEIAFKGGDETYRGKTLRQIRERMGIDLKGLSGETRINVKILEWIEEEAVDKLPALVYLKGFLRSYARSLGLDPRKVTEDYLHGLREKKR